MTATEILSDPEAHPWLKNALAALVTMEADEAMDLLFNLIGAMGPEVEESDDEGSKFKWVNQ